MRAKPCRDEIGSEKLVIRQTPRVRHPPAQASCCNDTETHDSVALGRSPSISRRVSENIDRGRLLRRVGM